MTDQVYQDAVRALRPAVAGLVLAGIALVAIGACAVELLHPETMAEIAMPSGVYAVFVDTNEDGLVDIVLSNSHDHASAVLRGRTDGSFRLEPFSNYAQGRPQVSHRDQGAAIRRAPLLRAIEPFRPGNS